MNGVFIMVNNSEIIEKLSIGTDETETVKVKNGKETIEVELRPLSSGELSILQKMEKSPYNMQMKINRNGERVPVNREDVIEDDNTVDVSMGDITESKSKLVFTAVAWAMDVSIAEVKTFHKGIPEQLFEHVIEMSNITEEDLDTIKQFRSNR
jgi:hypothetical protein